MIQRHDIIDKGQMGRTDFGGLTARFVDLVVQKLKPATKSDEQDYESFFNCFDCEHILLNPKNIEAEFSVSFKDQFPEIMGPSSEKYVKQWAEICKSRHLYDVCGIITVYRVGHYSYYCIHASPIFEPKKD